MSGEEEEGVCISPSSRSSSSSSSSRAEEGYESEEGESEDAWMDVKSSEARRDNWAERGRFGGKRMGKAFNKTLYNVTKLPVHHNASQYPSI